MTSQLWRVLLRAIVTDAALCTFRHKGRRVDFRCECCVGASFSQKQTFMNKAKALGFGLVVDIYLGRDGNSQCLVGKC
jgi:hypothetical protein